MSSQYLRQRRKEGQVWELQGEPGSGYLNGMPVPCVGGGSGPGCTCARGCRRGSGWRCGVGITDWWKGRQRERPFRAMGRRVGTRSSPGKEAEYLGKKNKTCGRRAAWKWMRAQVATARREKHFRTSLQTLSSAVTSEFTRPMPLWQDGWGKATFSLMCGAWIAYLEENKDI